MKATLVLVVLTFMADQSIGSRTDRLDRYAEKPYKSTEECITDLPKAAENIKEYFSSDFDHPMVISSGNPPYHFGISGMDHSIRLDCYPGGPKVGQMDLDKFIPKEKELEIVPAPIPVKP